jgi:hypothetical protein
MERQQEKEDGHQGWKRIRMKERFINESEVRQRKRANKVNEMASSEEILAQAVDHEIDQDHNQNQKDDQ